MINMRTKILVIILAGFVGRLHAQCELKTVPIGNFTTIAGKEISNCIIGYSTLGRLNADKSNIVVWPTWITGKSSDMCKDIVPVMMDTSGLFIIVIDAFGNGISSSPSNQSDFPEITIRDMVNAQYILLTRNLHIDHVKTLMGISMGGLQVMEWL